jgi:CheY-like chemotaxis protein
VSADPTGPLLLYVEDELLVQEATKPALSDAGYEVLTADSGADALALIKTHARTLRALVTDVNLGKGADGWEVAQRGRETIAGLAVIYVSGAAQGEWASRGVPGSLMIGKPFAPAQVVVAVSSLLNAPHAPAEGAPPLPHAPEATE